jgi:hypothetical protein
MKCEHNIILLFQQRLDQIPRSIFQVSILSATKTWYGLLSSHLWNVLMGSLYGRNIFILFNFCSHSFEPINRFEFWRNLLKMTESQKLFSVSTDLSKNEQNPVHQLQCCSFFEDGTKFKIFSEIYLSLTAMNWLYGRMNRFHLPWTKVQPKFERKCRPSIIILVWSNTYSALQCKFHSF